MLAIVAMGKALFALLDEAGQIEHAIDFALLRRIRQVVPVFGSKSFDPLHDSRRLKMLCAVGDYV